jgi:hypothetical protein
MRDINMLPQSWTVDDDEDGGAEPGDTEAAARSISLSYARV